ncbi:MAG: hypothetical protein IPG43_24930 [Proteobacteria bacterium]|nr:hypothetical protein [Pseudomonadota bacterium]
MNDPAPRPPSPASRRRLGALAWRLLVVALVLAVLMTVGTAPGLRLMLRALAPTLEFSALEGSLLDGVTLRDPRFVSPAVKLAAAEVSVAGRVSLRAGLALREVRARRLVIELPLRREGEARKAARVPLPLRVDALRVDDLAIVHGARRYEFATLDAAFDASATAWSLREFVLRGERQRLDGHAHYQDHRLGATFEGRMTTSSGEARAVAKLDGPLDALRVELERARRWRSACAVNSTRWRRRHTSRARSRPACPPSARCVASSTVTSAWRGCASRRHSRARRRRCAMRRWISTSSVATTASRPPSPGS